MKPKSLPLLTQFFLEKGLWLWKEGSNKRLPFSQKNNRSVKNASFGIGSRVLVLSYPNEEGGCGLPLKVLAANLLMPKSILFVGNSCCYYLPASHFYAHGSVDLDANLKVNKDRGDFVMKYLLGLFCALAALGVSQEAEAVDYSSSGDSSSMMTSMGGVQWETNFQRALKTAQEQNKPILILFTGSDWCTWCIRLENEVFSMPAFAERMRDKFVYVKLDFPHSTKLPPDVAAQNNSLKTKYGVQGFPSVIVLNSRGEKIGSLGYQAGGPGNYSQLLLNIINKR